MSARKPFNWDQEIEKAFSELKKKYGGNRNEYFGLVYLEREFGLERDRALNQVAFGGNDYGIDGFHFDPERRNLYLFQFKWSKDPALFKSSFQRLIDAGMEQIFGAKTQDRRMNQLIQRLKICLIENQAVIDRVLIYFVFKGDPEEAERNQVLDALRENLENKKYLIDQYFKRPVQLVIEFRSPHRISGKIWTKTHKYQILLGETVTHRGPNGETMIVGFIRLKDLYDIYRQMDQRFFERNIRGALPEDVAVNRAIQRAIRRIVLDRKEDPSVFAFNHNGVTLSAEALTPSDPGGQFEIIEPRLLNGVQTIKSFERFLEHQKGNALLDRSRLEDIRVMCRIITQASPEFVTMVTINNNRQNPVNPWNLRANDLIQLEIQEWFRKELGIYYERQEHTFKDLTDEELEEMGITEPKAVELPKLARTFLVSDGELDKLKRFREVFEDDRIYKQIFNESRLKADIRHVVLCYKVQFRLRRLVMAIAEKGPGKYAYVHRARNLLWALLCQAILNDPRLEDRAEAFGRTLSLEAQYTEWLSELATTRCRFILSNLVADKAYAPKVQEGNFSFLNTNAAYKRSMEIAYRRWGWVPKRLR